MGVEITINREKCNFSMYDPKGCKQCLQICTANVFASRPKEKRDWSIPREKRIDPTIWVLLTTWEDYCTGCGACVKLCPTKALEIKINGNPIY